MIVSCHVCGESFDFRSRREMTRFVPMVCSGHCFNLLLTGYLVKPRREKHIKIIWESEKFKERSNSFRSDYEVKLAKFLYEKDIDFYYEEFMFRLSNGSVYVPDFFLKHEGVFIEVKGLWLGDSKKKIKLFTKEYGHPLFLVDKEVLKILKK